MTHKSVQLLWLMQDRIELNVMLDVPFKHNLHSHNQHLHYCNTTTQQPDSTSSETNFTPLRDALSQCEQCVEVVLSRWLRLCVTGKMVMCSCSSSSVLRFKVATFQLVTQHLTVRTLYTLHIYSA